MSEFSLFFSLGVNHILDVKGYDHILFVLALSTIYLIHDWKKVLLLVTAFTIGHSLTLALATLKLVQVDSALIEFLIPITIFVTAFYNILRKSQSVPKGKISTNYLFALFFGLIHGLGFSNYLMSLLGRDQSIVNQLFAFNVGLEVGQIVIVLSFLILSFLFVDVFRTNHRDWKLAISSAIAGISVVIIFENKIW